MVQWVLILRWKRGEHHGEYTAKSTFGGIQFSFLLTEYLLTSYVKKLVLLLKENLCSLTVSSIAYWTQINPVSSCYYTEQMICQGGLVTKFESSNNSVPIKADRCKKSYQMTLIGQSMLQGIIFLPIFNLKGAQKKIKRIVSMLIYLRKQ